MVIHTVILVNTSKKKENIMRNLMKIKNLTNQDRVTSKINTNNPEVGAIASLIKNIIKRKSPQRLKMRQLLLLMIFTPKVQIEEEEAEELQIIMIELLMKGMSIEVEVIEMMKMRKSLINVIIIKMKKINRIRKKIPVRILNNHKMTKRNLLKKSLIVSMTRINQLRRRKSPPDLLMKSLRLCKKRKKET